MATAVSVVPRLVGRCPRRLAAPLLVAALLSGCAADGATARIADSCAFGGACAPAVPSGLVLAAELVPSAEADVGRTEYTTVRFDGTGSAHLSLPPRVPVVGRIVDEGDQSSVTALVTATRAAGLPGLPPVTRSTSTAGNGGFAIELTEGQWTLQILPQGASQALYPPESQPVVVRAGMAALGITMSRARTLAGVILSAPGGGVEGVKVRLKDKSTGNLLSSEATTDKAGAFRMALASDIADHEGVRLQADGGGLSVSLQRTFEGKAILAQGSIKLSAPPLPTAQPFVIPLLGHTQSGADKPVAGAQVDVAADLSEPGSQTVAVFATSGVSDQDGNVALQLIPGAESSRSYTVTITPANDSTFNRGAFAVSVGPKGGQLGQLRLDSRPTLVGQIVGPGGAAVGNAIVAAQPAASLGLVGARGMDSGLPQVQSDSKDGRFLLRLELGQYDLLVTPPWDSGLALGTIGDVVVSGNAELPAAALPRVAAASVVLIGPGGEPVPGVEVRLYSDLSTLPCPDDLGCRRPRLRAEGTSGADGRVRLLVGVP